MICLYLSRKSNKEFDWGVDMYPVARLVIGDDPNKEFE